MKRPYIYLGILILIILLAMSGCKKKIPVDNDNIIDTTPDPKPVDVVKEDEKKVIMEEFANIVQSGNAPEEIISFINDNIGKLSQIEGNQMIDSLELELVSHLQSLTDKILDFDKDDELISIGGTEFVFPKEKVKEIKNKELKAEVEKAYKNFHKFINIEGNFYPIIDYSKLKAYNSYITDEWKEYLSLRAIDSDNVPLVDGGLRISFDELANRLIKSENYLNNYIDGQRNEEVLGMYENKLDAYLKGVPNTPIANPETHEIFAEVLASYKNTSNVENHVTAHVVYKYLETIKANNNIIDDKVLKEAQKLLEEAMEILTEYK